MIKREISRFLVVGSMTVMTDYLIYRALQWADLTTIDLSKAIGFTAGTLFAYFANRFWTFNQVQSVLSSPLRFAQLYGLTLVVNVAANSAFLIILAGFLQTIEIAFVLSTGISAILNFLGMKYYVFKNSFKGNAK
jgi:putative flippase GtrA